MLNATQHRGFTLVEILITLLILCIGFLGLASLQAASLKHSVNIATWSQAGLLASALAERLRAHPELAPLYPIQLSRDQCGSPPSSCAISGNGCSGAALVNYDHWQLFCRSVANSGRPGSSTPLAISLQQLDISCEPVPCNSASRYTITLTWQDRPTATPGQQRQQGQRRLQRTVIPQRRSS